MRKFVQSKLYELCYYLEIFIAIILVAAIGILSVRLILNLPQFIAFSEESDLLYEFLGNAMTLAVGVEFIKMLSKHTPGTLIEVLLFAIARQMVVEHLGAVETLVGVAAIAALFATRKYLFINIDETDRIVFRGSQKVRLINKIEKIHIPTEDGETLNEVMINMLNKSGETIIVGACIYYKEFALRIDNMQKDVITSVELIKYI